MTDFPQPLILTIEDEPAIRDSFRNYLEDFDYHVIEAPDGVAGLEAFRRHQPDLVLLDLRMPGMDGIEVLAQIREISPDTPVIIVSGTGLIEDVVEALRQGAQDYLLKPIEDLPIVRHAVDRCLERARLVRENRQYQQQLEEKVLKRTRDLAAANRRLKKSESKYRLLFESMRHGFALCRPADAGRPPEDYRLMDVNPAFESMVGMGAAALKDQRLSALFPGVDFQGATQAGADRGSHHVEYHDPSQDRYFDMLVYLRENRDLVLVLADISERQRLKEQLQQAQKMEAIGTLAGGIAHDFNNILGAIVGYGELAMLDLAADHPARRKVGRMIGSCDRAKELVRRILSFSRQNPTENSRVRMDRMVVEVLELLRAALPTTIEIRKQIRCAGATVHADPTQVHQILMNLCTNAHHAMRKTGGRLTIRVDCVESTQVPLNEGPALPAGAYVCLTVRDTGTGMDSRTLKRAFDPYFTTKPKGEGTGLGLAVVHGLVKRWKGEIGVKSGPGKGTTFSIYLPRIDDAQEAFGVPVGAAATGCGRILMVDDEQALVLVGREMLARAGYTVTVFTCPEKALGQFREAPGAFDLVLTDMTMPKLTGDQLAREIHRVRPDLPVILCTGYVEAMETAMASEAGYAAVLMKPLMMDALIHTVGLVLEKAAKGRTA
ncbi:hypothetical protein DSCA_54630 [Desulfosarcina alkanivorans]|uniref:histidine kinase n=1 Tax=Desulfosarcina alkanivorans TaxID=571177 RepID=A0A5K7YU04_9BACT|nr:response regulator [Desulfosarcina alkanivorans]BBO71533.1 hypothetical protein DSCA_54630 [Desulfosarcina alkanivorans]